MNETNSEGPAVDSHMKTWRDDNAMMRKSKCAKIAEMFFIQSFNQSLDWRCLTVLECFKVASLSKCIQFHSLKNNIRQISSLKEGCPSIHLYRPFLIIMHSVLNWVERTASEARALFYMQNKTLSWWSLPSRSSAGDFPGCPALTLTLPVC